MRKAVLAAAILVLFEAWNKVNSYGEDYLIDLESNLGSSGLSDDECLVCTLSEYKRRFQ